MDTIRENLQEIRENIEAAAKKAGRRADEITLIGVTKTIPVERIQALVDLGVTHLGENKVQELLAKFDKFNKFNAETENHVELLPEWHMIGHLQTNKVKYIIDKVKLIQSVDSIKLAEEINRQAGRLGKRAEILVEVNIANEDTKYGINSEKLEFFIEHLCKLSNICLKGLMCIAPYVEVDEQNRGFFEKMMNLFIDKQSKFTDNTDMQYLSMGMTNDYRVAIEEGANMVRIGTGLFGSRA